MGGLMTIIPVIVFMLAGFCKPDQGTEWSKYHPVITFPLAVQASTFVGGFCLLGMFSNWVILLGSLVWLFAAAQFISIASCVGHKGEADGYSFTDLNKKQAFLFATTVSTVGLTISIWNIGWSGSYNMFIFI